MSLKQAKLPANKLAFFRPIQLGLTIYITLFLGVGAQTVSQKPPVSKANPAVIDKTASEQEPPRRFQIPVNERGLRPLAKPFTLTGEVVDSWCYASQVMGSGRGEGHKACGLACAHGGVTIGIVDDTGRLYIAAKSKGFTGCKDLLTPYMAKRVTVTGWLASKGGANILKIQKVELAK